MVRLQQLEPLGNRSLKSSSLPSLIAWVFMKMNGSDMSPSVQRFYGFGWPGSPTGSFSTAGVGAGESREKLGHEQGLSFAPSGPERHGARLVQPVLRGGQDHDRPVAIDPDDLVLHADARVDVAVDIESDPIGPTRAGDSASTVGAPALRPARSGARPAGRALSVRHDDRVVAQSDPVGSDREAESECAAPLEQGMVRPDLC